MIYAKTEVGQQLFKQRDPILSPRQRSAFILFDGRRNLEEVLRSTAALGITLSDVQHLVASGVLAPVSAPVPETRLEPASIEALEVVIDLPLPGLDEPQVRSPRQRYTDAYPIAVALTASLGLRGFRLNLAVEGAGNLEELRAVAPRIREAVGPAAFAPLERALQG